MLSTKMKEARERLRAAKERVKNRVSKPAESGPHRYHLLLQGDVLELVNSETVPDLTTKPGERRKVVLGSYRDENAARKAHERMKPRARGVVGKGKPY